METRCISSNHYKSTVHRDPQYTKKPKTSSFVSDSPDELPERLQVKKHTPASNPCTTTSTHIRSPDKDNQQLAQAHAHPKQNIAAPAQIQGQMISHGSGKHALYRVRRSR